MFERDPRPLAGQVAIVTGAASGICRQTAYGLSREGATVVIVDRDADGAAETAKEIEAHDGEAIVIQLDIADSDGVRNAVASVVERFGRIDILVNGAFATHWPDKLFETSDETWEAIYAVCAKAPFIFMQAVGRHMVERGGGGHIVNITAASAFTAEGPLVYASAKAALTKLTRGAAWELGPHDINVNAVSPGITLTPAVLNRPHAPGGRADAERDAKEGYMRNLVERPNEPEDVAAAVVFLCLPESRQIAGQTIHVDGGMVPSR